VSSTRKRKKFKQRTLWEWHSALAKKKEKEKMIQNDNIMAESNLCLETCNGWKKEKGKKRLEKNNTSQGYTTK
jgi:ribosomal protein L14E/L6E/L27E